MAFDGGGSSGCGAEYGEGAADEAHAVLAGHLLLAFVFYSMSKRWVRRGCFAMHKTSAQPCSESRPARVQQ
jgi:hypothetical protein